MYIYKYNGMKNACAFVPKRRIIIIIFFSLLVRAGERHYEYNSEYSDRRRLCIKFETDLAIVAFRSE